MVPGQTFPGLRQAMRGLASARAGLAELLAHLDEQDRDEIADNLHSEAGGALYLLDLAHGALDGVCPRPFEIHIAPRKGGAP
ncbi:MAG: hypothetical protein L0Y72_14165 [Gemmataceae bacterium]|nr:hypothetical protein [Gemmataceae bacterium]